MIRQDRNHSEAHVPMKSSVAFPVQHFRLSCHNFARICSASDAPCDDFMRSTHSCAQNLPGRTPENWVEACYRPAAKPCQKYLRRREDGKAWRHPWMRGTSPSFRLGRKEDRSALFSRIQQSLLPRLNLPTTFTSELGCFAFVVNWNPAWSSFSS